ncbi:MAG TPA: cysteine desulfurase NifS [Candidatus Ozemobacteraceae bacterium]|nr:cysteine desulfurase NifS [Candidatus Ozemobacteraceae bacterium]
MSVPARNVYLDNNATTCVAPEVLEAMLPFFNDLYGNASSMHLFGGQVARHLDTARSQVAALLNAQPEEIVFTSCGTESDNHAIRGVCEAQPDKRHIITTKVEHPAVLNVCRYLAKKGYRVTELGVDKQGNLNLDELKSAITPDTAIVTVMAANNETGTLFPIDEIAKICAEKGVTFHTDAVQAAGKIALDMQKMPVNLLSISGHKLHAPKGIGILYVRRGTRISPFMLGGHQERNRRAGTENAPYIVGLGKACEVAINAMFDENNRLRKQRDRLEKGLFDAIPYTHINGNPQWRLPNTTNLGFEFIEGEAILLHLSAAGIAASSGSACTSGSLEPSHVLMAMQVPFTYAHGSVRFSLSRYTTDAEIDHTLAALPPIVEKLRGMSPFYADKLREMKAGAATAQQ